MKPNCNYASFANNKLVLLFLLSCCSVVRTIGFGACERCKSILPSYGHILSSQPIKSHYQGHVRNPNSLEEQHELEKRSSLNMGWFDNFLPKYDEESLEEKRRLQFPEQYPATYELLNPLDLSDNIQDCKLSQIVRPLLKQTYLEQRNLHIAYNAERDGWSKSVFHNKMDGKGASLVLAITEDGKLIGGYNPKGWASMGGARPSVAAFLFYGTNENREFQKLRKVGGGGLACAFDDPNKGIYFGPDALVISLEDNNPEFAQSKLGPYFERGSEELSSLFWPNMGGQLVELYVFVGKYSDSEEIPYSGAVLDMTSG